MPMGNILFFLVNAVTLRREFIFNRVVILLLLYSGIVLLGSNRIGVISDIFHSNAYEFSLILYIVASIILLSVYVVGCYFRGCRVKPGISDYRVFMLWGIAGAILAWLGWDLSNQDLLEGWLDQLGYDEVLELSAGATASAKVKAKTVEDAGETASAKVKAKTVEEILGADSIHKIYKDIGTQKVRTAIIRDAKGKGGIFCIMNKKTKDKYVMGHPHLDTWLEGWLRVNPEIGSGHCADEFYTKLKDKKWVGYSLYIIELVDDDALVERIKFFHDKLKPVENPNRWEWSEEENDYIRIYKKDDPVRFYAGHPRSSIRVGHIETMTKPKVEHQAVKIYRYMLNLESRKRAVDENHRKAGVYRWVNWKTKKSYIGCSEDLGKRLGLYLNQSSLEKQNQNLVKAVKRSGWDWFSLEILEYCKVKKVAEREQYYIDLYRPEYNKLKPKKSADEKAAIKEPQVVEQTTAQAVEAVPSQAVETVPSQAVEAVTALILAPTDENIESDQPGLSQPGLANQTDLKLPVTQEAAKEESQPLDSKNLALNKLNDTEAPSSEDLEPGVSSYDDEKLDYSESATYKDYHLPEDDPTTPIFEVDLPGQYNYGEEPSAESDREEEIKTNSSCDRELTTNSTCEQEGELGESSGQTEPISQASTLAEEPAKPIAQVSTLAEEPAKSRKAKSRKWTLTSETKAKMRESQSKREKHPRPGQSIVVRDLETNEEVTYASFREAAAALKMSVSIISRRIKLGVEKPYKGRYEFRVFIGSV